MSCACIPTRWSDSHAQSGFTVLELLVSMAILLILSATALGSLLSLTKTSGTISNRTEMHAAVRNATELLQQEVGQAGRVTFPFGITLASTVDSTTFTASSTMGLYAGEYLTIDTGGDTNCSTGCEETVMIGAVNTATNQISVQTSAAITKAHRDLWYTHAAGAPLSVVGGFAHGVVPTTVTNGPVKQFCRNEKSL